ncbi:ABC transporter permease [Microaerobacter geothermalis]|uniref:ABC transporter permease n=1 Tax=Microaerobacter geothermalis TaxID=674972 RepID=UPI001F35451E|nr:ABC transporter permease [Microaerobacter geothermalis]MCF6094403.1 ABC transporter permease [Microaerobacter geothermalis]
MFFRMMKQLYSQGIKEKMLIFATILFAAALITAILTVSFDIGDKMNRELKSYGANIRVVPAVQAGISEDQRSAKLGRYIEEQYIGNIKTIFWTNNILGFSPYLSGELTEVGTGRKIKAVGTWFQKELSLPTGEIMVTGIKDLKKWWEIDGRWPSEQTNPNGILVGKRLAKEMNLKTGDSLILTLSAESSEKSLEKSFMIDGIISGGGEEEEQVFISLEQMQDFLKLPGKVEELEVSALTVPDTELAERAEKNPALLSEADYETWYCTAFVGAIAYQIEEVIPGTDAKAIRQISDSEGNIMKKVEKLMFAFSLAALASAALGISNLMMTKVLERQREIGLMKALGASNGNIVALFLVEAGLLALIAGMVGFSLGLGLAQWLGQVVFQSFITIKWLVLPITLVISVFVVVIGSLSALRFISRLKPADVLHIG